MRKTVNRERIDSYTRIGILLRVCAVRLLAWDSQIAAQQWKGAFERRTQVVMAQNRRKTLRFHGRMREFPRDERPTKLCLAIAINEILEERHLSQASAAKVLGISQPKVSALENFKLDGFSVERLLSFLTALGRDVEIMIRKRRASGEPKILVSAA